MSRSRLSQRTIIEIVSFALLTLIGLIEIGGGIRGEGSVPWANVGGAGFISPAGRIAIGVLLLVFAAWSATLAVKREKKRRRINEEGLPRDD